MGICCAYNWNDIGNKDIKREKHSFQDYETATRSRNRKKSAGKESKINSSFEISKLLKKTYAEDTSFRSKSNA